LITTREYIENIYTIIFGYSSPDRDIKVGEVIGPGKLTQEKIKNLVSELLIFQTQYNAMLKDYAGSEIYFIEFELFNIDEKDAKTKLYPNSMIFIPGSFKDCESLLLALKPEKKVLEIHNSRESLNRISKLFFEVEEFTRRPDLNKFHKEAVLAKFATHFTYKLQGDLLEGKWNKKLVGIKSSTPTEDESMNVYSTIKGDNIFSYEESPPEIRIENPIFVKIPLNLKETVINEHTKYFISSPSAYFITLNTLKLGANLLKIANTGTIDEIQEKIVTYLIEIIAQKIQPIKEPKNDQWLIDKINTILINCSLSFSKYFDFISKFIKTGETGNLEEIIEKLLKYISHKIEITEENYKEYNYIVEFTLKQLLKEHNYIHAAELESTLNYLNELFKKTLKIFIIALPKYFFGYRLKFYLKKYIQSLRILMENKPKLSNILGNKFIDKLDDYISNLIEKRLIIERIKKYDETQPIEEIKEIINSSIMEFFEKLDFNISDLISFSEIMMDEDPSRIRIHLDKLKVFPQEIKFLLNLILRYSTINRFLRGISIGEIQDPVTFGNFFHRFLQKRVGGIDLKWSEHCLNWIKFYVKQYLNIIEKKDWQIYEIVNEFIDFLEKIEKQDQDPKNFSVILNGYIETIINQEEKSILLNFSKHYQSSLEIKQNFPKYIENIIIEDLKKIKFEPKPQIPLKFIFPDDSQESLFEFLERKELKYFSKLIARPMTITLKHILDENEKDRVKEELYHVFDFQYWHNNLKIRLKNNWNDIYKEWMSY